VGGSRENYTLYLEARIVPWFGEMRMIETDIDAGLRWGEVTELRPKDFNFRTRRITVARAAEELMRRFHPEGGRFLGVDVKHPFALLDAVDGQCSTQVRSMMSMQAC
jgi:hypothetical protein